MNRTIEDLRKIVEAEITKLKLPKGPKGLYEPVKYVLEGGGKRLRPVMLLAFVQALGGDVQKALNQAVGLEVYHNFTLLHDDIMDKADMRHGRPTVNVKWNDATGILSGDVMLTLASIYMMKDLEPAVAVKVMSVFNETAIKVDEGQQLDMDFEQLPSVSIEQYEEMIMLKTGALFACAASLSSLLAGKLHEPGFEVLFKNLARLGYLFGVTFQLQDDLLDTFGDPATFGKAIGGDILNEKKTWLLINLLDSDLRSKAIDILQNKELSPRTKINDITSLYLKLNLREKLEKSIQQHLEKISDILLELDHWFVPGGKEQIEIFISTIMGRKK